jgi:RNA-directed DNA polymerase
VLRAREYQSEGKRWVVDLDLKQFFDEVNHDILMARIGRRLNDRRVVRLIRKYLRAGLMAGGIVSKREKGTPQGGPLSPLLSNILLDDLDKELERRGHSFCRYADDCNIYVSSRRAGERVLKSIKGFVERRLKLKVNEKKSAVDRPWRRKFLGYTFSCHFKPRIYVSGKSIKRFKSKLKALFRQGRGRNLFRFIREVLNPVLRGWMQYYHLAESRRFAKELDQWIRRRLRGIIWRQWKRPRKRFQMLCRLGIQKERAARSAGNQRGPWFNAGASHMSQACPCIFFTRLGLLSLLDTLRKLGPILT